MISDKKMSFIVSHSRLLEILCMIYSAIGLLNMGLEIRLLYFQETGITGWYRQQFIFMIGFFFSMFLIGYLGKMAFAVINKSSNQQSVTAAGNK